jgi:flagellar biogenesis protein FliO
MKTLVESVVRLFAARRGERPVRVVDQVPLFGGAALHVVDVDGRRLVFATSNGAICLLAQFRAMTSGAQREEESCGAV